MCGCLNGVALCLVGLLLEQVDLRGSPMHTVPHETEASFAGAVPVFLSSVENASLVNHGDVVDRTMLTRRATLVAQHPHKDLKGKLSVVATDYIWDKTLSVHHEAWRTGGLNNCEDKQRFCGFWKRNGECKSNPTYLHQNCPKSCNLCRAALPRTTRCQRLPSEQPIIHSPNGLNNLFERIMSDPEIVQRYKPEALSTDPWVVVFENFVTKEEGDALFETVKDKFQGSTVIGKLDDTGAIERQTLQTRTSTNAWCNVAPCMNHSVHVNLQKRLAHLTSTDPQHMENMQLLDYSEGQFYHPHHDTIKDHITMMCGPRVLTALIYFTDAGPDDGGATRFGKLKLKVSPKIGRMVLWPSMLDADSSKIDKRTQHEAMPVISGHKRAANIWIHLYDYKTASALGCVGA
eukprot:m.208460 g.208460  ORF g.208460 m.208460 type:complete len:404 (-) comp33008_c3_seq2:69-1280(-)